MAVHVIAPVRSGGKKKYKDYRRYKPELRTDFNQRCGYCDDHDRTFGGVRGFHIDHFAPKSTFPELEIDYSNLIYSCPFCNIAKSDLWFGPDAKTHSVGDFGFVDPCDTSYGLHVSRNSEGQIYPISPLGRNIIINLKLYLLRHRLNWQMDKLQALSIDLARLTKKALKRGINIQDTQVVFADLILLTEEYTQRHDAT